MNKTLGSIYKPSVLPKLSLTLTDPLCETAITEVAEEP